MQKITKTNLKEIHDIACASWKTKLTNYAIKFPFDSEVKLEQSEIDEMYSASDSAQKSVLDKFFVRKKSIIDRIKAESAFSDAFFELGLKESDVFSDSDDKDIKAYKKLKVIIKALNEGWYPNWESNEYKYYNYWIFRGVFCLFSCFCHLGDSYVPSALCLKSEELARHAAKVALEEYKEFYS